MKVPYSLFLLLSVGEWLTIARKDEGLCRIKLAKLAGDSLAKWKREVEFDAWRNGFFLGGVR
jgi:hypothetical protein